jgi:hypothetical protein
MKRREFGSLILILGAFFLPTVLGAQADSRRLVSLEGRLALELPTCPRLETKEGDLYSLSGDLRDFANGDKVRVIGFLDGRSPCGEEPAIEVRKINRRQAPTGP